MEHPYINHDNRKVIVGCTLLIIIAIAGIAGIVWWSGQENHVEGLVTNKFVRRVSHYYDAYAIQLNGTTWYDLLTWEDYASVLNGTYIYLHKNNIQGGWILGVEP